MHMCVYIYIYICISYHIISYHIISYHIISYHIISYHTIQLLSLRHAAANFCPTAPARLKSARRII